MLLIVAAAACLGAAFPLARFFFDDFDTFKEELPDLIGGMGYFKVIGFAGILVIIFLAAYSLATRIVGAQ